MSVLRRPTCAQPNVVVRRMIARAVDRTLTVDQAVIKELQGAFLSSDEAWAQFVLLDARRLCRMWPTAVPFGACLLVSDAMTQAFGPPPPPLTVMKASGLSRNQFVTASSRGRASKLALNPMVPPGADCDLILEVANHAATSVRDNRTSQIHAVGQIFRCLHTTSRRIRGERVEYEHVAADWAGALDDDALPLHLLGPLMTMCHAEPTPVGLSVLLILVASPSAWVDRRWSQYGIHNFMTDVLALWGNVARRAPPQLELWARESCRQLARNTQDSPRLYKAGPKYLREYDPETDQYFACYNGLVAPSVWMPASDLSQALKEHFATRRAAMRATETGKAFAALLSSAAEIEVPFARRLAHVLDALLQRLVPGDPGLNDTATLQCTAATIKGPGYHVSWHALVHMPRLLRVAIRASPPQPNECGPVVVFGILKEALRSKSTVTSLLSLARQCSEPTDVVQQLAFPAPSRELRLPKQVLLHAAMSVVSGTDPAQHRYSAAMAALAAFVVPAADVLPMLHGVLFQGALTTGKYPIHSQRECVLNVLMGLARPVPGSTRCIPGELQDIVLRHWIVSAALAL